jgi:hypothetical protein
LALAVFALLLPEPLAKCARILEEPAEPVRSLRESRASAGVEA